MEVIEFPKQKIKVVVLYSVAGIANQVLIRYGKSNLDILVDVGDGILRDLLDFYHEDGKPIDPTFPQLRLILLTHGHLDHVGGLFSLLCFLRARGRETPLSIYYPEGSLEIPRILDAYFQSYPEVSYPYIVHTRELSGNPEGDTGERFEDFFIRAYTTKHYGFTKKYIDNWPQEACLGFRIMGSGLEVAITGDTGFCNAVENLVKGVDLAIIEETRPTNFREGSDRHLNSKEAKKLANLAKDAIFYHKRSEGHEWRKKT